MYETHASGWLEKDILNLDTKTEAYSDVQMKIF